MELGPLVTDVYREIQRLLVNGKESEFVMIGPIIHRVSLGNIHIMRQKTNDRGVAESPWEGPNPTFCISFVGRPNCVP